MLTYYTTPVFNLPAGPKNLTALLGTDWTNVEKYYVELKDNTDAVLLRTPDYYLNCCCDSDKVRMIFRNAMGMFDGANFMPPVIYQETKSSEYKTALPANFQKSDASAERFNISVGETYECLTTCYGEEHQDWLMEMARSGKAFLEWKGTQGQSDSYIPIKIIDGKFVRRKNIDQFYYPFAVTFTVANDIITQR